MSKRLPRLAPAVPGLALAALGLLAAPAAGQSEADLREKYEKKLADEWIQANDWITDYDEARAQAEETGKPIFAYFTRSYAY